MPRERDPLLTPITQAVALAQASRPLPDAPPQGAPALPSMEAQGRGILNPFAHPRQAVEAVVGGVLTAPTSMLGVPGPSLTESGLTLGRMAFERFGFKAPDPVRAFEERRAGRARANQRALGLGQITGTPRWASAMRRSRKYR